MTIFNIVVDSVVRSVLLEVCGPQEAHHRFVWAAGEHNIFLYVDDGQIAGHNPIWVQTTPAAMASMFKRVGIQTNLGKTKAMMGIPGLAWVKQVTEAYKRRATGEGSTFVSVREPG